MHFNAMSTIEQLSALAHIRMNMSIRGEKVAKDDSGAKRAEYHIPIHRHLFGDLPGQYSIPDLISVGALLPEVLNELCASLDCQIGNIVSVILPSGQTEDISGMVSNCARQYGLHIFWSGRISSAVENRLGTLQIFSCNLREPTSDEVHMIQRVVGLAALALQRRNCDSDFAGFVKETMGAFRRASDEGSRLN
jgi:hypothetical protein